MFFYSFFISAISKSGWRKGMVVEIELIDRNKSSSQPPCF
jgi:hypothetical protein